MFTFKRMNEKRKFTVSFPNMNTNLLKPSQPLWGKKQHKYQAEVVFLNAFLHHYHVMIFASKIWTTIYIYAKITEN